MVIGRLRMRGRTRVRPILEATALRSGRTEIAGVLDHSEQEFVRVGYKIEEGVEIGLVLSFVQPVEVGAFFRAGFILFFLFDE